MTVIKKEGKMGPDNAIRQTFIARAEVMMARLKESEQIAHEGTKGSLREAYLKDFLVDSFSHRFDMTSGFITDALGSTITPQIDLIIYDNKIIPAVQLGRDTAIVPYESVKSICEVKSSLQTRDLDQIIEQNNSIKSLSVIGYNGNQFAKAGFTGVPIFFFCYRNTVLETTLRKWFDRVPNLWGICVLTQFLIFCDYPNRKSIEKIDANDQFRELLVFTAGVFDIAAQTQINLSSMGFLHSLRPYLQADELQSLIDGNSPQNPKAKT
jgi:hypothetical protein